MTPVTVALPAGEVAVSAVVEFPPPPVETQAGGRDSRESRSGACVSMGEAAPPWAALALAHGAGAGMDHPFLVGFAAALRAEGVATLRFDFPYRAAGRRMPGPPAHALATWSAVMAELAGALPGIPQVAAGKSYGGRMASMAAADGLIAPDALVYLGYPFHPPGKPEATRGAHLARVAAPQLFVEGTTDPFIQPVADFEASVATSPAADVFWVEGGGHSFEVKGAKRDALEIGASLAPPVLAWLRARLV